MAKKPLSEHIKCQKQSRLQEKKNKQAVKAYRAELKKQVHRREYTQLRRSMELKNATKKFLTGTIICKAPKKQMRISKISQLLRKQSL